jgi:hypothetical protein
MSGAAYHGTFFATAQIAVGHTRANQTNGNYGASPAHCRAQLMRLELADSVEQLIGWKRDPHF